MKLESKHWDCNFTLDELFEMNDNKCFLDINYHSHKSDDCFGRFQLEFPYEGSYIEVGVCEDGFVYSGDRSSSIYDNFKEIPKEQAIKFMERYKNFMNAFYDFEAELVGIAEESCINIIFAHNYGLANKRSSDKMTFIDN